MRGRVVHRLETGTATVFVVEAVKAGAPSAEHFPAHHPLVYHDRTWHALGSESIVSA